MLPPRTRDRVPPPSWRRLLSGGAGFSLVEVLVALTIVGIFAAMSIPRASRVMNQTKVQRAAQALQMEVQQAFAIAGRNREPTRISWNAASTQLRITNLAGTTIYRRLSVGSGG